MPAKYPPARDSEPHTDDEGDEEEEDEEEDEEEHVEEWTDIVSPDEMAELEDGPSTRFVGGFSVCHHLGDAIDETQFKEDVVLVFPGVYPAASAAAPALELNEAKLGGLRVYSVAYARDSAQSKGRGKGGEPRYAAAAKRRVGPWFTYLTAAATAAFLTQDGSASAGADGEAATAAAAPAKGYVPLQAAAAKAAAAADGLGPASAAATSAMTTTSGSSVFGPAITATTANPRLYPIFDFPISVVYNVEEGEEGPRGLPHYVQQDEAEEAGDEDGEDEAGNTEAGDTDNGEDDAEGTTNGHHGHVAAVVREEVAITLAGICARAGLTLGSITRTQVTHCVIGFPQPAAAAASAPLRIALTGAPLCEALVSYCIVYGGSSYGVYAYPRCAMAVRSCVVEGPNAAAAAYNAAGAAMPDASSAAAGGRASAIAQLQQREARSKRLRRYLERFEEGEDDADAEGGSGGATLDVEDGVLPRFTVPGAGTAAASTVPMPCEVAVMCDDADLQLTDSLLTHTRHGLLLHGACTGTVVRGVSVRSVAEVGVYVYGVAGAADVQYSTVQACGQVCLLVVGPSAAELAEVEAALPRRGSGDDEEEEDAASGSGTQRRRPVLAQHPHIRANTFVGIVRVQGEVRSGAMVDNFVYCPREELAAGGAAVARAAAAQTVLSVTADAARAFAFVGMEGDRAPSRAADQAAAA